MATFTMELHEALEFEPDIGLSNYPIFDEDYRKTLNDKIIQHYWNQEIGMETVSMFKFALQRRMNEIMPLYNQHYELSRMKIDPLSTVSIKSLTTALGESTGTAKSTANSDTSRSSATDSTTDNTSDSTSTNDSSSTAKSRAVASDTPQNQLSENGDYASSMQDSTSQSAAEGNAVSRETAHGTGRESASGVESGTSSGNEERGEKTETESTNTTEGYSGHTAALIMQTRQALVNVDMMIIGELRDLFMLIWSTNDSYTPNNRLGPTYYGY